MSYLDQITLLVQRLAFLFEIGQKRQLSSFKFLLRLMITRAWLASLAWCACLEVERPTLLSGACSIDHVLTNDRSPQPDEREENARFKTV